MTTRREQLAAAFPDHIERIEELTDQWRLEREPADSASRALAQSFWWGATREGHRYWAELAKGAGRTL